MPRQAVGYGELPPLGPPARNWEEMVALCTARPAWEVAKHNNPAQAEGERKRTEIKHRNADAVIDFGPNQVVYGGKSKTRKTHCRAVL